MRAHLDATKTFLHSYLGIFLDMSRRTESLKQILGSAGGFDDTGGVFSILLQIQYGSSMLLLILIDVLRALDIRIYFCPSL